MHPDFSEGNLTEARAYLVCEKTLAEMADEMNVGQSIKFSKTEIATNGKHKDSILADTFEALIGAMYLDSDVACVEAWILEKFDKRIENLKLSEIVSYKSALQNYIQSKYHDKKTVSYRMVDKKGPDHKPTFRVEVLIDEKVVGKGTGTSLKSAEKEAARCAYESIVGKL